MIRQLPRHSGPPFHPSLSPLDFGTCSGLRLPLDGRVMNSQDGLQLRVVVPPFVAYNNDEIDPRLHDERHRWPIDIDAPSWMLPMSYDAAYSYASKKYPSMGVQRGLLYDLFFEDAELLRHERRNYSHGNALRLITAKLITKSGTLEDALFALHPAGPFMNVLQLSHVVRRASSSTMEASAQPKSQLIVQSSIDVYSTILDISAPSKNYSRCDRLIAITTTSQFVYFVRLRTEDCSNPQIELLHRIHLSSQPFPSVCNPLILHECALISGDGHVTIYDASTCTESYAIAIDPSESAWLRQSYTPHPRVIHIASRRKIRRLDLRTNMFANDVAGSLAYNHDPSLINTAFNNDLQDPFSFAVANWDHISLFDERYTARPVLRWQHHRQKRPITHIEISTYNEKSNSKMMSAFGHEYSHVDVYRFLKDNDGFTTVLGSSQQLDTITHAKLRGIAFASEFASDRSHCYRLTELGTVFCSEYRLVDDSVDYGEPCPVLASEDPLVLLSRSSLTPYEFIDFANPIQDIIKSNNSRLGIAPTLSEHGLSRFMSEHQNKIIEFVSEWRSFSDLYHYLRSELNMPAASSSLDFYNAVHAIVENSWLTSRLIPGISDQEANSTMQSRIAPPNFPTLCACSLTSISDCQPSVDCSYPGLCQALLRSAIGMQDPIVSLDLEDTWAQVKAE